MGYTDPPWGAGNARSFRTKAGLDGDKGRPVDFAALIQRVIFCLTWAVPNGPVWVEMGRATADDVERRLKQSWPITEVWPITYYNKNPCSLIRAAVSGPGMGAGGPGGMDDAVTPAFAIARDSAPGDRVYDPCTGRGLTAVSAAQHGRVFRGSELNPRRLSVTLAKLHRLTGCAPQRIGAL